MCFKNCACTVILLISVLVGVLAGIAFFNGLLPLFTALPILVFVFALVASIFTFLFGILRNTKCICRFGGCILVGSGLSILLSSIASILTLATESIGIAILVGLLVAAFLLSLLSFFTFLACLLRELCRYQEPCCRV